MKKIALSFLFCLTFLISHAQSNVGIGTETPDPSAVLDIVSDSTGLLIPRMETAKRAVIPNPAQGLLVFDTDSNKFMYFDGTLWKELQVSSPEGWNTAGNIGTTSNHFVGTLDSAALHFKVNNLPVGRLSEHNIFWGRDAGANDQGATNIGIGRATLYHTTEQGNNIAIGDSTLFNNGQNLFFPYEASGNIGIGNFALFSNDRGNDNLGIGDYSLYENTIGSQNVAVGKYSMYFNEVGFNNTGLGYYSLSQNTTGYNNTALGANALNDNVTGNWNVAVGVRSLRINITGESNTAIGMSALNSNYSGSLNTAIGRRALYNNGSGELNVAIGYGAGDDFNNSLCTFVGSNTGIGDSLLTNATAIGYTSYIDDSNQVRVGNAAVLSIGGFVPWSSLSDARTKHQVAEDVKGLDFVMKLRPVTYQYDMDKIEAYAPPKEEDEVLRASEISAKEAKGKIRYSGFLAQEVASAAKTSGYDFSGVDAPSDENKLYALRYAEFVVPLVKSMQEQQEMIEELHILLRSQEDRIKNLEQQLKTKD